MPSDEAALLHWATLAGQWALPVFLAMLAALLLGVAAAAWAWRHPRVQPLRRRPGSTSPFVQLAVVLALGFGVIVGAAEVFAEMAEGVQTAGRVARADQALIDALQASVPPAAVQAFSLVTRLGDTLTFTLIGTGVALWLLRLRRTWLAFAWVVAVGGNALLNTTLKQVFARVRPVHDDGLVIADGYSFPSGHSSGSLVVYGMLAYLALRLLPTRWHLPAVLLASATAFSVAASRVFLRVHFPSDVIAGAASGAAWLAVCIAGIEITRRWQSASR